MKEKPKGGYIVVGKKGREFALKLAKEVRKQRQQQRQRRAG